MPAAMGTNASKEFIKDYNSSLAIDLSNALLSSIVFDFNQLIV